MKHAEKQKFKQPKRGCFQGVRTISANVNCGGLLLMKKSVLTPFAQRENEEEHQR